MNVLNYEDVAKITRFLVENGYGSYGITIKTEVDSQDVLNKVNEEFFYRTTKDKKEKPVYGEEVNVSTNGIKFSYSIKEN